MRMQLSYAEPGTVFTADAARGLIDKTVTLRLGGQRPVLALVVLAHVENDEHGSRLVVTLDYDPPSEGSNGRGVLGTPVIRAGRMR